MKLFKIEGVDIAALMKEDGYTEEYIDKCKDHYYCFIAVLISASLRQPRGYQKGYARIYTKEVREWFPKIRIKGDPKRMFYLATKDFEKWGIVLKKVYGGKESKGRSLYKLKDEYFNLKFEELCAPTIDQAILDHYAANLEQNSFFNWTTTSTGSVVYQSLEPDSIYYMLEKNAKNIELDSNSATELVEKYYQTNYVFTEPIRNKYNKVEYPIFNEEKYNFWNILIDNFINYKYASIANSGRFYTSMTNFPRDLRKYLHINGRSFLEIDISNCQPLLLAPMMNDYYKSTSASIPVDVIKYQKLCETGKFYEYFIEKLDENNVHYHPTRSIYKRDIISRIFFSTGKVNYKFKQVFEAEFPMVYKFIEHVKEDDYKALSHALQKQEAELMINQASRRLIEANITEFYVLHDAIYATAPYAERVKEILLEELALVNLHPIIKIKDVNGKIVG